MLQRTILGRRGVFVANSFVAAIGWRLPAILSAVLPMGVLLML
jgi:hypothetical protein